MSRQFRYRVAAIVLGGLIFGAPLLTSGWASAEPVPGGARKVTFDGGGMLGLTCRSRPDIESLVVPAETRIRVVNDTGHDAQLQLGGRTKGTIPENASTDVVFRRGTIAVLLKPNCSLGDDALPLMVTASPTAPAVDPDPTPAPTDDADDLSTVGPADMGEPFDRPGSPVPNSVLLAERPPAKTSATGKPSKHRKHTPGAGSARVPRHAATAPVRVKDKDLVRTAESPAPAFAGMPPGDKKALVPAVPEIDLEPPLTEPAPAAFPPVPSEVAAAEPVSAMEPMPETAPIGLLAVIASVCALGVLVATIRAIVSQRVNRAIMS